MERITVRRVKKHSRSQIVMQAHFDVGTSGKARRVVWHGWRGMLPRSPETPTKTGFAAAELPRLSYPKRFAWVLSNANPAPTTRSDLPPPSPGMDLGGESDFQVAGTTSVPLDSSEMVFVHCSDQSQPVYPDLCDATLVSNPHATLLRPRAVQRQR
jgi:hypothetical protein